MQHVVQLWSLIMISYECNHLIIIFLSVVCAPTKDGCPTMDTVTLPHLPPTSSSNSHVFLYNCQCTVPFLSINMIRIRFMCVISCSYLPFISYIKDVRRSSSVTIIYSLFFCCIKTENILRWVIQFVSWFWINVYFFFRT